jgi:hypothetical protein
MYLYYPYTLIITSMTISFCGSLCCSCFRVSSPLWLFFYCFNHSDQYFIGKIPSASSTLCSSLYDFKIINLSDELRTITVVSLFSLSSNIIELEDSVTICYTFIYLIVVIYTKQPQSKNNEIKCKLWKQ